MPKRMNNLALTLLAPVVSVGLLATMAAQDARRLRPEHAEEYHARVKAAIEAVPEHIGTLVSARRDVPQAAMKLLRPNVILSRSYTDVLDPQARADLLIVHCRDPRDMLGHFPPVCYRGNGNDMVEQTPRKWVVKARGAGAAGREIQGMEYVFEQQVRDPGTLSNVKLTTVVYNFLVVPDRSDTLLDMDALQRAAKDYQRRAFGAAQFQLVFFGPGRPPLGQKQRDELFAKLVGSALPAIDTITNASKVESGTATASRTTNQDQSVQTVANGSLGTGLYGSSRSGSTSH